MVSKKPVISHHVYCQKIGSFASDAPVSPNKSGTFLQRNRSFIPWLLKWSLVTDVTGLLCAARISRGSQKGVSSDISIYGFGRVRGTRPGLSMYGRWRSRKEQLGCSWRQKLDTEIKISWQETFAIQIPIPARRAEGTGKGEYIES